MNTTTRKFRVSLNQQDSEYLKEIAETLGLTESEVIRKGLKLMALYAQTAEEPDKSLILRDGNQDSKLMVL